ncbi:Tetratricopeptide repeat-containing protein [Desulfovibrio sp. X2]|uniref:tetratricopeptide repeat protein n=1 Tax=Desulfovibrio sp. X2 TaxID=941449 RepID=UPI00035882F3|nr:tetratricopeptide repeat protein [Desulfovibrio sp. X2]EPR37575.1 Tetratricopeptide repeat-containing protein [Desulfovibrio sp. X2]
MMLPDTTGRVRGNATAPLVLTVILAALLAGCAARQPQAGGEGHKPVQWTMTEDGASIYYYMLYLDERGQGHFANAQAALDKAIELDPSSRLYEEAAEFQWRLGHPAEAREYIKKALAKNPDDRLMVMRLADSYAAERRFDDAMGTLQDWLRTHPGDATALLRMADIQVEARRYPEALQTLASIQAKDKGPETSYLEAKAYAGLGKRRKAIDILKKLSDKYQDNVLYTAELAYQYELAKDYVAAEETYSRILEMGEAGEEVWLRLISLNLKLNNPERAMTLVQEGPQTPDFVMEAARTFLSEGFPEEAAQLLEPLTHEKDVDPKLYFYLALLSYENGKNPQKALDYLDKIPADNELAGQAMGFKARMLVLLGKSDEAMRLVRQGKRDYPEIKDFWDIQAMILEDRGQLDEAKAVIDQALSQWPGDAGLLYHLGLLQQRMGKPDAAIATMERIIADDPTNADALNFVGYLLADQDRDLERALVLVKEALDQKPGSGYIVDSLAWVYFHMGKLPEAFDSIKQAVELTPGDPTIWEHYGDIAAAMGKRAEARKAYRKSLDLGHDKPETIRQKLDKLEKAPAPEKQ